MEFQKYLPWIQGQVNQNFCNKQAIIILYFNNITLLFARMMWRQQHAQMKTQKLNLTFYKNLAADSPKYVRKERVCTVLSEVKMKLYIIVRPQKEVPQMVGMTMLKGPHSLATAIFPLG
jgi:hypothetical protein